MKLGVIADDLTGANATGVKLSQRGFSALTVVYGRPLPANSSYKAILMDTDSRYAPVRIARERVRNCAQAFTNWGAELIAKRIDSTVRGNLGAEIDTLLEFLGDKSVAVVVPSFPESGRITSGGYLLVNGTPVQQTDVAKDPVTPITGSYVPDLVANQSQFEVGHIGLNDVLAGKEALTSAMEQRIQKGIRILVIDAVTEENIEEIACAMNDASHIPWIPVDPGPLTAMFAKEKAHKQTAEKKYICTVGSITAITGSQLRYLLDKTTIDPVYVSAEQLASFTSSWDEEIDRVVDEVLTKIHTQDVLLITTHRPAIKAIPLAQIAAQEGTKEEALAKRITDGLGKITRLVVQKSPISISGCYTSGGDVTASLCAFAGANGIELEDEVIPLASYGKMVGGYLDGMPIVTKGGMIGGKDAIYQSIQFLKTKHLEGR